LWRFRKLEMRLRLAKHWRRANGPVCRRSPHGEWEHLHVRLWGYWLQYQGPCREFHLEGDMPSLRDDEDLCCCDDENCPGDCVWAEEDDDV
jgi:hypothetical protein